MLSGNKCAYPGCCRKLIGEDGKSIIGKICHIAAASPEGARYDKTMTDDERRGYANLILLCDEHHVIIDNKENEALYPTHLLKEWKYSHEKTVLIASSNKNLLSKYPLALNKVINFIGKRMSEVLDLSVALHAPDPDEKILFNNIVRYEPVVMEFAPYQAKLNKIYEEIEREGSTKKELVLHNIRSIYLNIKKEYPDMEAIRRNADIIMDKVVEALWDNMANAPNKLDEYDRETIDFSLMIVIVDAFMRCNILEEPPKAM